VVNDDYAGIGMATGWLAVAATAEFVAFCMLAMFSREGVANAIKTGAKLQRVTWYDSVILSAVVNGCVFLSVCGISVAYAWTISTLPALGPVIDQHSKYLAHMTLQNLSFAMSILFASVVTSWTHATDVQTQRAVFNNAKNNNKLSNI